MSDLEEPQGAGGEGGIGVGKWEGMPIDTCPGGLPLPLPCRPNLAITHGQNLCDGNQKRGALLGMWGGGSGVGGRSVGD